LTFQPTNDPEAVLQGGALLPLGGEEMTSKCWVRDCLCITDIIFVHGWWMCCTVVCLPRYI